MKLLREFIEFKKMTLVVSNDYEYSRIIFVYDGSKESAMIMVDIMAEDGTFEDLQVKNYEVIEFESMIEMNRWIQNNVRENLK